MGIGFVAKILIFLGIAAIGYIAFRVISDGIQSKKAKKEYIQQIKIDIYYLKMLEDCPPFVILPDSHFVDMQNCLYKIVNLNADEIMKDSTLRSFMADYKNIKNIKCQTWHQYIIIL